MEVILLERVHKLGALGSKVSVKPGFARNYLVPMKKAVFATASNTAQFELKRADLERRAVQSTENSEKRAQELATLTVVISMLAAEEGKLYGSLSARDLATHITKAGVPVEKREVQLPNGPIRFIGEHVIALQLQSDVMAQVTVKVIPESRSN